MKAHIPIIHEALTLVHMLNMLSSKCKMLNDDDTTSCRWFAGRHIGIISRKRQYLVKQAKHMVSINQVSNHVHRGPACSLEKPLAQFGERHVVHRENLSDVTLPAF